jgi:ketosteroid isomerase-like protein
MEPGTFIEALRTLEEQGDLQPMLALYAEEAELSNPTDEQPHRGKEGAERFWGVYRRTFDDVHSEFRNVATSDSAILLEWTSQGRLAGGVPFEYDGVSVVEHRDGRVRRFRAYFDPHALSEQVKDER